MKEDKPTISQVGHYRHDEYCNMLVEQWLKNNKPSVVMHPRYQHYAKRYAND
jgi:hypothetical protein